MIDCTRMATLLLLLSFCASGTLTAVLVPVYFFACHANGHTTLVFTYVLMYMYIQTYIHVMNYTVVHIDFIFVKNK